MVMAQASQAKTGEQGKTAVDVEAGVVRLSLSQRLKGLSGKASEHEPFIIFRLPGSMRQCARELHEPSMIAIGPYHRDNKDLRAMEVHKLRYLRDLLFRWPETSAEQWLEKCVGEIKALEARARRCYAEDFDLSSEKFVEMLLLDGCFIIEFLNKLGDGDLDIMVRLGWSWHHIRSDFIRLENQIPFFVFDALFNQLLGSELDCSIVDSKKSDFRRRAAFILAPGDIELERVPDFISNGDFQHLLHLRYTCFMPFPNPWKEEQPPASYDSVADYLIVFVRSLFAIVIAMNFVCHFCLRIVSLLDSHILWARCIRMKVKKGFFWLFPCLRCTKPILLASKPPRPAIPCATDLQEAGIRFRPKAVDEEKASSFLEISFDRRGYMEIPQLIVEDDTKPLLMNLVAFEQCDVNREYQMFMSYAALMDALVNTEKDVAVLRSYGVLENHLSSDEELSEFFNQLCKSFTLVSEQDFYLNLENKVLQYYESKWPRWRAKLVRDYFSNPWSILSLAAAVILLILTIAQTILTFFAYFRPPS